MGLVKFQFLSSHSLWFLFVYFKEFLGTSKEIYGREKKKKKADKRKWEIEVNFILL